MKRLLPLVALIFTACATHQVRFDPWAGVPASDLAALKRGEYSASKDQLFDAAATTLEHEPYLHWEISSLDKVNGLLIASAGVLREVQLRVAGADNGGAKLGVSVPRRELKTSAKIYVKKDASAQLTAYEPDAEHLGDYNVVSADVELNEDYFRAFTWHALHDRNQVPFRLEAYEGAAAIASPAADAFPLPTPHATPVPLDEGPRLPVRADAGANTPSASSGQAPSASSGQAPSASSGQAPSASSGQAHP